MVKRGLFFLFAALAVATIVLTALLTLSAAQEFDRVSQQISASGVDYLAANMLKNEAITVGLAAMFNTVVALTFGLTVKWRK